MSNEVDPEGMLKMLLNDRHGERSPDMLEVADTLVIWVAGGGWLPDLQRLDQRQCRTLVYYAMQHVIDDIRRSMGELTE